MKNFLSNLWSLLVGSRKNDSSTRLRVDYDSFTCRLRVWPLKIVSVLVIVLTIGIGNAWGAALGTGYTKITSITSLSAGDKVVLYCDDASVGVTGYKSSDATVAASGWIEFTVEKSGSNYFFKTGTNYIKKQTSNKFSIDATAQSDNYCTVNDDGVLCINSRYLCKNGNYYRMYTSISSYKPFYVYKVAVSCTTDPTVTAGSNSSVTATTATVSCLSGISSLGSEGCSISSYGFVLGTSANPTIGNTVHEVGTSYPTTGTSFSKDLTGLSAETTYYVHPYATNGNGTAYGTQTSFTTPALPKYTVTWKVGGSTTKTSTVNADTGITAGDIPSAPADDAIGDCANKFMGWSATELGSGDGNDAPADLFTTYDNAPDLTGDLTLHAVFATSSGGGSSDFTLVTDVSQLQVGDIVTIANFAGNSKSGSVIKAYTDGNNWPQTSATTDEDGKISERTTDMQTFTLEKGSAVDTWAFYDGTGYPYAASSDRNYMKRETSLSANSSFAITIDGASVASVVAKGSNTRNIMRYNSSNSLFSCYASGQNDIYIYRKQSGSYSNYKTYCDDTKAYVNYNAAGGTTSCTREAVTKGTNYTVCSSVPTKTGYTFQGWLSDEATPQTYQPNTTISNVQSNITLTAQWAATTYTITYNGVKTGATNTNPTSYTVEDLPINLVAATHDQWRFDGWTDDNAGDADITTIPVGTTGNQNFTAHWTQRYAVTWHVESTPTVTYFDPGATLQFPADPSAPASCSEKKFVGWMVGTITGETDDKPTFITAGEVNADAAYHAVWATQYEESGTKTLFSDQLLVTGTAAVSTPRNGWSDLSNVFGYSGNGVRLSSSSNGASMIVDLRGKELGSTLTITFDAARYSSDENGSLSLSCLDDGANPTFSPASFTISNASWEERSCTITNVDGKVASITLTGTKSQRFYMKNFKVTTSGMITKYKEYSTSCCDNNVAAPSVTATATRNSITLSWANVTGATGYKVTINGGTHDVTTAACTYTGSGLTSGTDYAWTVIATYNPASYCGAIPTKGTTATLSVYGVTYNKNTTIGSGTVTMSPMPSDVSTYVVGENVTAAAKPATCTNSGYTFNGWNTEPDGTGTHVDAGGTIAMVEGGLTLYAEWVAKRAYYIDRMHGQGDQTIEIGGKTYHCYYGDGYHTTPSPSDQKSGDACQAPHYRFVRWLTITHINNDGTQKDTGGAVGGGVQRGTVIDGETYYAIWEEEIDE